jgi:hypothetical protein
LNSGGHNAILTLEGVPEDPSHPPESLACPICHGPLRRTGERLLSALECEHCGPFTDFDGAASRSMSSDSGPDDSGSDPVG